MRPALYHAFACQLISLLVSSFGLAGSILDQIKTGLILAMENDIIINNTRFGSKTLTQFRPGIYKKLFKMCGTYIVQTRKTAFAAVLVLFMISRCGVAQSPILPQDHDYQVQLYNWLQTITIDDVTLPVGAQITWDGTYDNNEHLAELWALTVPDNDNAREFSRTIASEAKWYVLDDGQGHGIEGLGRAQGNQKIHLPRRGDRTGGYHGMASQIAWWYQFDLPLNGNGQGNPLYKHKGAGNRALVIAAVDMMMLQQCIETTEPNCSNSWGDRSDFIGGYLISAADAVEWAGDLLDEDTRAAFFKGMEMLVDRMLEKGAKDVNSNMDGKAVEGCALADKAAQKYYPSHAIRDKCVDLSKLILFGYTDGRLEAPRKLDSEHGIFYLEGLVREADGPETTYNGRSFAHMAAARTMTHGDPNWSFMDGVIKRMCSFIFVQHFERAPKSSPFGDQIRTVVPDGYSNRTTGGMERLQSTPWAGLSSAYLYEECKPMAVEYHRKVSEVVPTQSELRTEIAGYVDDMGEVPVYTEEPQEWEAKEPWPTIAPYTPPEQGWHSSLRNMIDNREYLYPAHPDVNTSYNRTFPASHEAGNKWWDKVQWLARRDGDPGNEFAYFVEATLFSGTYKGYYSGKVEAFWREGQGPVIIGLRELKKSDYGWDNVEKWRVEHVWGYDENGGAFSWGRVNGDNDPNEPTARTSSWNEDTQTLSLISPMEDRGEESDNVFSGSLKQTKEFVALSNGLEVTTPPRK